MTSKTGALPQKKSAGKMVIELLARKPCFPEYSIYQSGAQIAMMVGNGNCPARSGIAVIRMA